MARRSDGANLRIGVQGKVVLLWEHPNKALSSTSSITPSKASCVPRSDPARSHVLSKSVASSNRRHACPSIGQNILEWKCFALIFPDVGHQAPALHLRGSEYDVQFVVDGVPWLNSRGATERDLYSPKNSCRSGRQREQCCTFRGACYATRRIISSLRVVRSLIKCQRIASRKPIRGIVSICFGRYAYSEAVDTEHPMTASSWTARQFRRREQCSNRVRTKGTSVQWHQRYHLE